MESKRRGLPLDLQVLPDLGKRILKAFTRRNMHHSCLGHRAAHTAGPSSKTEEGRDFAALLGIRLEPKTVPPRLHGISVKGPHE